MLPHHVTGSCYLTDQWGELRVQNATHVYICLFGRFLMFIKTFVFLSFSFLFFDEASSISSRTLTNQKLELVIRDCHWNCMQMPVVTF